MFLPKTQLAALILSFTSLTPAWSGEQQKPRISIVSKPRPAVELVDNWVSNATAMFEGKSLAALRKTAKLKREIKSRRPFHDGETSTPRNYLTLEFDGLSIGGFPSKDSFAIDEIIITSPTWVVPNGLVVGSDAAVVPTIFGLPKRPLITPKELFGGWAHSLMVHSENGKISKIEYFFFYD